MRRGLRDRLARSKRARLGLLVLAAVILPAIFAELVAADAPVVAVGQGTVYVLPAVIPPASYLGRDRAGIAEMHADDAAWWPMIRCGPRSACAEGPDQPASWTHPLGTDAEGRDLLARAVYGARNALGLALVALVLATVVGVLLGAVSGYLGGFWDEMLARPIEVAQAFPAIVVVAVARAAVPEEGAAWSLIIAVASVRWAEVARLVRAEVIHATAEPYVLAARALGAGHLRVLRHHIMPRAVRPVIASTMFGVVSVVLLEAAVSFLGLGLEGSWGVMLAEGMVAGAGPVLAAAGLSLLATVLGAYLVADAFQEALEARVATTSRGF